MKNLNNRGNLGKSFMTSLLQRPPPLSLLWVVSLHSFMHTFSVHLLSSLSLSLSTLHLYPVNHNFSLTLCPRLSPALQITAESLYDCKPPPPRNNWFV